jgi:hypothetical protein
VQEPQLSGQSRQYLFEFISTVTFPLESSHLLFASKQVSSGKNIPHTEGILFGSYWHLLLARGELGIVYNHPAPLQILLEYK